MQKKSGMLKQQSVMLGVLYMTGTVQCCTVATVTVGKINMLQVDCHLC